MYKKNVLSASLGTKQNHQKSKNPKSKSQKFKIKV